jgi:O-antigen ligase
VIPRFDFVRTARLAYLLSVAMLIPIQKPLFSLNVIIFDYVNAVFIGFFLVYFIVNRSLEMRLVAPAMVILIASMISMINSEDPALSLVTLTQELYLYVFFIVVSNVIQTERHMRLLAGAAFLSAAAFSVPLILELLADFTGRAEGYFTDDNGAAGYLGALAFLVYYPFDKSRRLLKPAFLGLILLAVFATKSISGALSFLLGTVAVFVGYWFYTDAVTRKRIFIGAIAAVLLLIPLYRVAASQHNFLDRLEGSEEGREGIWSAGLETFAHNPLGIGIGPARFKEVVIVPGWSHRKELHSDYLASLVERGILGFIGLLMILFSIGKSLSRCLKRHTSQGELLWILGLCGMFVFTLVDAVSHETLHNRHVWLIYAMIVAQERISTRSRPQAPSIRPRSSGEDDARVLTTSLERA